MSFCTRKKSSIVSKTRKGNRLVGIMYLKVTICAFLVSTCICAEIPKTLKKCNRKDSNFAECLRDAIEDALHKSEAEVKEIGLRKLEPLDVPSLTIGAGTGAVGFAQNYRDLKLSGFSKIKCSKADMNFDAKTLTMDCAAPLLRMDFNYDINGNILVLPIKGKGPGFTELTDLNFKVTFVLEEYDKKGKRHYKLKSHKLLLTPNGGIKFKLDNLFDGDKTLGDNMNKVLNENWREVFADVKSSYEDAYGQIIGNAFDRVLTKVSVVELFGEE